MYTPAKPSPQSRWWTWPSQLKFSFVFASLPPYSPWQRTMSPGNHWSASVIIDQFIFSRIAFKCSHIVCFCLDLTFSALHNCFEIYCCMYQYFIIIIIFAEQYPIVWMYPSLAPGFWVASTFFYYKGSY